jgi:hypothetical protein
MPKIFKPEELKELKQDILDRISEGESLLKILKSDKKYPARQTVYNWLNKQHKEYDPHFLDNYARAKEDGGDLDAERIEEIALKALEGEYNPNAARVAIDALKWTAGKKRPKKYGDKLDLTTDGESMNLNAEERKKRLEVLQAKLSKLKKG